MQESDFDTVGDENSPSQLNSSQTGSEMAYNDAIDRSVGRWARLRGCWVRLPGSSDRFVIGSIVLYFVALAGAWWLVYMGTCTGASCFVVKWYPPFANSEAFTAGVVKLRASLPWLVPTAYVVFQSLWLFLGWTLWIKGPSAWNGKSEKSATVSVLVLFAFVVWIVYVTLNEIQAIDWTITIWIAAPSSLCAVVAGAYLDRWRRRERDSARVKYQVSESMQRVEQISNRAKAIARSGLIPREKTNELLRLSELGGVNLLEEEIAQLAAEMISRSNNRSDIRSGISLSSPPRDLMLHSIAASQNLARLVNGPFWKFAKAPAFRAEVEWGLKALASELSVKLDRLNAAISAELRLIWDDLGRLEGDAGEKVVSSGEWLTGDEVTVMTKFEDSGWDGRRRPTRSGSSRPAG